MVATFSWRGDAPANILTLAVGRCLIAEMNRSRWLELGLLTDTSELITGHARLLRSLSWSDDDYDGCVFEVVPAILGEEQADSDFGWGAAPAKQLSLRERFPKLDLVTEYLDLPNWLAVSDEAMFKLLFDTSAFDATLPDGTVLSAADSAAARLQVGEMRRQVERIRRDYSDDPEAAVGQAKELVETTCKTILGLIGDADANRLDIPKLVTQTLLHLGLDPSQVEAAGGDLVAARAAKRLLGGVGNILNGAAELRNARGTGHGRSGAPQVDAALGRLAVGVVLPALLYLVDAFESTTQDGDRTLPLPAANPSVTFQPGEIVKHPTFGHGQVTAVEGPNGDLVVDVDFGAGIGPKRLRVRYAPLTRA